MSRKKKVLVFNKHRDDFVSDFLFIADDFYYSTLYLLKGEDNYWSHYLMPAGFLASRSAECYLKALVLAFDSSEKTYKCCLEAGHNLSNLLDLLKKHDPKSKILTQAVNKLNKYSGDKVSYPEPQYYKNAGSVFGSDDVVFINKVRSYVVKKLGWEQ